MDDDELDDEQEEESAEVEDELDEENPQEETSEKSGKAGENDEQKTKKGAELAKKKKFQGLSLKLGSILSVALPVLIVFVFLFMLVSLAGDSQRQQTPWLFEDDGSMSSPYGIKGADFYGARTIYKDNEQAQKDLIKNYTNTIVEIKTSLDADEELKVTINLATALPANNYDFSKFATDYADTNLYSLVNAIADSVYLADNAEGTASTFAEKIAGIKYFGYNQAISEEIAGKVRDYLLSTDGTITPDKQSGALPSGETLLNKITEVIKPEEQKRTEMVYVKDYILDGAQDYIKNLQAENYVAFILMPRKAVNITKLSFNFGMVENFGTLKVYLTSGQTLMPFVYMSGQTYKDTIYQVEYTQRLSAQAYTNIEAGVTSENNLLTGLSLYDILHNGNLTSDYYLKLQTGEGEQPTDVYTYVADGVGLKIEYGANGTFFCGESETNWE